MERRWNIDGTAWNTLERDAIYIFTFSTMQAASKGCQKFDLQRVDLKTLSNHLKSICQNESISFENDSISHICKASEGSVRDALSLLDQAASLCGDNIKEQTVLNMLGLNGYEKNIEFSELHTDFL